MKSKKAQGLSLDTIMIAVIILIVLVVLWAIFTGRMPTLGYNEDLHICEDYECSNFQESEGFTIEQFIPCDFPDVNKRVCSNWRLKTPCEKDPNKEICKCEEEIYTKEWKEVIEFYELLDQIECRNTKENCERLDEQIKTSLIKIKEVGKKTCIKAHKANECEKYNPKYNWDCGSEYLTLIDGRCIDIELNLTVRNPYCNEKPKPIKINLEKEKCVEHTEEKITESWDGKQVACKSMLDCCNGDMDTEEGWDYNPCCDWYDYSCCTKKEKLNECERGEDGWTLDGKCYGEIFKSDDGHYLNCTTGWVEFCRKNTIRDYNCTVLKRATDLQLRYCDKTNKFSDEPDNCFFSGFREWYYTYDIAKERGCI